MDFIGMLVLFLIVVGVASVFWRDPVLEECPYDQDTMGFNDNEEENK
jgi:hypothetical protein